MRQDQWSEWEDPHRCLKLPVDKETGRAQQQQAESTLPLSPQAKAKQKPFPKKARSAVDFQKVWQLISLHARVSGNLIIPAIYLDQQ